tara:strand:- start:194 stop:337 length:144 start_codon:yes stop_codon:yes gene_type:complete
MKTTNKRKHIIEYLASIGKKGGSVKSKKKADASAINGAKGGRPKSKK